VISHLSYYEHDLSKLCLQLILFLASLMELMCLLLAEMIYRWYYPLLLVVVISNQRCCVANYI
jgi:hypothetical protein